MGGGCFDSELDLRRGRSSSISEKAMIDISTPCRQDGWDTERRKRMDSGQMVKDWCRLSLSQSVSVSLFFRDHSTSGAVDSQSDQGAEYRVYNATTFRIYDFAIRDKSRC